MLFLMHSEGLLLLSEQQFEIALGSRLGPCFRHKLPVVVWFCINRSYLFDFFHQIVTLVALAAIDDTAFKTVFRDSGTLGKEFAATISTIAVNRYLVPFFSSKGSPLLMRRIFTFSPSGFVTSTS